MESISADQTMKAITRAVTNRSRIYNNSFALSVRWERDRTNAPADTDHFQAILSTLNLDQAEVEILAEQDQTPGWTLNDKIRSVFRLAANAPGKSIVLIHYAGNGEVKEEQLFAVEGLSRRSINLQRFIDTVVAGDVQDFDIADTDAVFVLDCCYSHVATRTLNSTTRVVEILSASDDYTPEALTPPRNTLTGKLRGEIARRKRDGHHFMILSDVMATIRGNSSVVKPTHHVKLGVSVCFPFNGVTRINPNTIAPSLHAVFSVRIAENMTREQLDRFLTWIETLPPGFAMELDGIYTTTSTLLIFQSAYALFTNLVGYPGVTFISDVTSPNCRKHIGQEQRQEAPSSTLKENVPLSRRPKP
ncbi:hypothetical protein N7448_009703 [Penicillium atrosanguineum]|uniref:Uncharacterized protein n=1 Tax=Penicillium atrosanguineum TaxID=1132637 RepID=A0A9W9U627_9EURO|nr:uncharacterized protein N7443_006950 [Penicillium atrosanguineum]KAJ5123606.1 hypothetical protein N7448_009703 [Penicillium atrosanguineum]KAJ5142237.1 hypothetical protein N7526_003232 [Penicillium atrosanguineum]KAJ5298830.1 hypothetical protein N7443_006950 [Penicillium atrosanguineum]KAJ5320903.1 hypothetical protein N7476_003905 [Penicillium atrosanguineum]